MKSALAFLLVNLPALALAQNRWLGTQKERQFREAVAFFEWQWVLPAVAFCVLFAYLARRRFWNGLLVWGPTLIAVVLVVLLGARGLIGFFFDRVDVEKHRKPARTSAPRR